MEYMKDIPDKWVELAIVDPPYFDGPEQKGYYDGTKQKCKGGDYKTVSGTWDIPDEKYFNELFRISKNQIIWGVNYYDTILKGGRIVWIKSLKDSPMSTCDIAFQSFYNRIDSYYFEWRGMLQGNMKHKEQRIHPTQKPVALYKWLLKNYAKPGDKILDTHIGSGSIRIACHDMGFDLYGCELDKDYFEAQEARFKKHTQQDELFTFEGGKII
jgi:site-specific DNA-methyltransferase (adenine-specific)